MLWSLLKLVDLTTRREDTEPQYQSCLLQSPSTDVVQGLRSSRPAATSHKRRPANGAILNNHADRYWFLHLGSLGLP